MDPVRASAGTVLVPGRGEEAETARGMETRNRQRRNGGAYTNRTDGGRGRGQLDRAAVPGRAHRSLNRALSPGFVDVAPPAGAGLSQRKVLRAPVSGQCGWGPFI